MFAHKRPAVIIVEGDTAEDEQVELFLGIVQLLDAFEELVEERHGLRDNQGQRNHRKV